MTPKDPRWIGAWWLGFLMFGTMALVVSLLVFFFPRTIPNSKSDDESETTGDAPGEAQSSSANETTVLELLKGIEECLFNAHLIQDIKLRKKRVDILTLNRMNETFYALNKSDVFKYPKCHDFEFCIRGKFLQKSSLLIIFFFIFLN